eukprot:TRINITY_DN2082_c0_g1_i1.p1 TRINITY_DN2082_c0_g1~~TRINITY_DN2082_c0_g1_i1.p1  ORF type:complete len:159 (+),score=69.27 TRINITY_DN2082_c0_g1_i1:444-920(+)
MERGSVKRIGLNILDESTKNVTERFVFEVGLDQGWKRNCNMEELEETLRVFLLKIINLESQLPSASQNSSFAIVALVDEPNEELRKGIKWITSPPGSIEESTVIPVKSSSVGKVKIQFYVEEQSKGEVGSRIIEDTSEQTGDSEIYTSQSMQEDASES